MAAELGPRVTAVAGDVTDPGHRDRLADVVADGLDLLVNNASTLGTSPLVPVQELTSAVLRHVWETNVVAPMALIRTLRPLFRPTAPSSTSPPTPPPSTTRPGARTPRARPRSST